MRLAPFPLLTFRFPVVLCSTAIFGDVSARRNYFDRDFDPRRARGLWLGRGMRCWGRWREWIKVRGRIITGGNLCQCSKFCVYIFFSSKIFILKCKSKLFHRFYYCLKFELKWNDTWVSLGYRCKNYYRVIVLVKKKSRVFRSLKVKSSNHIYEKRTNIIWWIRKKETGI